MVFKLVRTGRSFNGQENIDVPMPPQEEVASRMTKGLGMLPERGKASSGAQPLSFNGPVAASGCIATDEEA